MATKLSGWGRYPVIDADVEQPRSVAATKAHLVEARAANQRLIARGLGRSYGDSAIASHVVDTRLLNHFHEFIEETGILTCGAGVTLAEILEVFVPRGWFLPVTPGTKFVTVAGAIASDVHGKNHHLDGTFGQHVIALELLLGDGQMLTCSPKQNVELFRATCGGMGLTGVIVSATIRLRRIASSDIIQTILKAPTLEDVLEKFEVHRPARYSVAWIDCLAAGRRLGRSLLILGEHATAGELTAASGKALPVPANVPAAALNKHSIRAFNAWYYHRVLKRKTISRLHYEAYFYPLDKLEGWNRLYGKAGFLQYQFVLPKDAGARGLREILEIIAASGRGSFLAVLKLFGTANDNPLSFPCAGYTLALDFKNEPGIFTLLDELDRRVLAYGGRLYLAKDARMSEDTFKKGYPNWRQFEDIRAIYHANHSFASRQSQRLGLQ